MPVKQIGSSYKQVRNRELLRQKESYLLNDSECKVATVKINKTYLFISSLDLTFTISFINLNECHNSILMDWLPISPYSNNIGFLFRNYRLLVAPRKFDVLQTNICLRSEALRASMVVLRTTNFQGGTIRPIVFLRHKHAIVFMTVQASKA